MRRSAFIALAGAAAGLALPAAASAAETGVGMYGRSFSPANTTVVVGDTVRWRNDDFVPHSVKGGPLDSGVMSDGAAYAFRFDSPGSVAYVCTLHTFMRGQVEVVGALLEASAGQVWPGTEVELSGRAPAGTAQVVLEQVGTGPVATATPAGDGTFAARVTPAATSRYRVLAGTHASDEVEVRVSSRVAVEMRVIRRVRRDAVLVSAGEPGAGLMARLQLYSKERFSWRQAAHTRLDAKGRARFSLRSGIRRRARVVLTTRTGTVVATSASVRLWRAGGVRRTDPGHSGSGHGDHHGSGGEQHAGH